MSSRLATAVESLCPEKDRFALKKLSMLFIPYIGSSAKIKTSSKYAFGQRHFLSTQYFLYTLCFGYVL